MGLEGESRRRLALGLSAIAPVLLVALWLAFSGSDDERASAANATKPAGLSDSRAADRAARPDAPTGERSREGLASLAERQRSLDRQPQTSDGDESRARSGSGAEDEYGYVEEFGDDPYTDEDSAAERDLRDEPTPEEVAELERIAAADTPPLEELNRMMEDTPPLPSPGVLIELQQRTADMLDIPEDVIGELAERSNAAEPTPEQLDELRARRDRDKALIGESD